jgi:hypothetical protein
MIPRIIIALIVLTLAFLALRWFLRQPPELVTRYLRRIFWAFVILLLAVLAARGQLNWIFAALGALIPLIGRLLPLIRYVPVLGQWYARHKDARSAGGGTSRVGSRYLRMELNHATGALDGTILAGEHRGARLSELSLEQIVSLWRELRVEDEDSARLLQAYLDRQHGAAWRTQAGDGTHTDETPPSRRTQMSREEALQILGLGPDASDAEIVAAHRRLMQKLHPDRGGSTYLAAKINQAKDQLLGR